MASACAPRWKRLLFRTPHLTVKCPQGNRHWFWDRLCFCGGNQSCGDWHGGIFDMKLKVEYQKCPQCVAAKRQRDLAAAGPKEDQRTTAQCTICSKGEDDGFYNGCILNDGHDPDNKWACDGNGNLTLKLASCMHDEPGGCLLHAKECGADLPAGDVNASVGKDLLQPIRPIHPDRTYGTH